MYLRTTQVWWKGQIKWESLSELEHLLPPPPQEHGMMPDSSGSDWHDEDRAPFLKDIKPLSEPSRSKLLSIAGKLQMFSGVDTELMDMVTL